MSMQKIMENHRLAADGGWSVFQKLIGLQPMRGVHIFENKTVKIFFSNTIGKSRWYRPKQMP
jgi:hypothetical protein